MGGKVKPQGTVGHFKVGGAIVHGDSNQPINSGSEKFLPHGEAVRPKPQVDVSDPHWQAKTDNLGKFVGSAHAAFRSSRSAPRAVHGLVYPRQNDGAC
jgi:hypothetical protein